MNRQIKIEDIDSKVYAEILGMVIDKFRENETLMGILETDIKLENENEVDTAIESLARDHLEKNWKCSAEF